MLYQLFWFFFLQTGLLINSRQISPLTLTGSIQPGHPLSTCCSSPGLPVLILRCQPLYWLLTVHEHQRQSLSWLFSGYYQQVQSLALALAVWVKSRAGIKRLKPYRKVQCVGSSADVVAFQIIYHTKFSL